MSTPLEREFEEMLRSEGIKFTRPERDKHSSSNLDFYLTDYDLYVEVKTFHTDRLSKQLALLPQDANVLILVGLKSVQAFKRLITNERPGL